VLLVLALWTSAQAPPSRGDRLLLLRVPESQCSFGDGRPIVVHFEKGGAVWINEENVGALKAPERIAEIMSTRAERAVFLLPGREATVQEVANIADQLHSKVQDLHIGIVTNSQRETMKRKVGEIDHFPIECLTWPREAYPTL
jgi:biopolymer transport protein ExbD